MTDILLTGLAIGESPRWHDGRLWFGNWGTQEIVAVDAEGKSAVMAHVPTAFAFCFDWLPDGRLIVVSGPEGLLLRQEPDGSFVTHADLGPLASTGWNDIVVDGRGNVYVNNIVFDFTKGEPPAPGFVAVLTPDGELRRVGEGLMLPNGMAVTPDGLTLIVAESFAPRLKAWDIEADGSLSNGRMWAELEFGSDGICVDADGAVWSPAQQGCVRVREGGEVVERVELDRFCFACMLGGEDGRTLFMMAADWRGPESMTDGSRTGQVVTHATAVAGAGWPAR